MQATRATTKATRATRVDAQWGPVAASLRDLKSWDSKWCGVIEAFKFCGHEVLEVWGHEVIESNSANTAHYLQESVAINPNSVLALIEPW